MVKHRDRVRRPWLYLGASGWLFLSLIIHWLGVSAYRGLEFDRIYESLFIFSPSIFGAAAAFVITPVVSVQGVIDLDKHYFSVAPWAFRLVAAFLALAGLSDLLVPGDAPIPLTRFLTLATIYLLLSFTARPTIHKVVLAGLWIGAVNVVAFV